MVRSVDLDDIALKKAIQLPIWKMTQMRAMTVTYTDVYALEISQRFPHDLDHARLPGLRRDGCRARHGAPAALAVRRAACAARALRGRLRRVHDVRCSTPTRSPACTSSATTASPYADVVRKVIWG